MASPEVLDFDQLLAPIAGENSAGEDLREDFAFDSIYNKIGTVRSDASLAEREALRDGHGPDLLRNDPTNWRPLLELGPKVIAERSKDLSVTAFLTEALVRTDGFAGLRDGFRLARRLVEDFWDDLYPPPDEDGMAAKVAPLTALNGEEGAGTLIRPIAKVPITQGRTFGPFSLLHYRMSSPSTGSQQADDESEAVTMEMFDVAVRETPREWFTNLLDDLSQCDEEFQQLCKVLEQKCGKDESGHSAAPPSSHIRKALKECRETVETIAQDILGEPPESPGAPRGEEATDGQVSRQIESRRQAFRDLRRVAEFFRRTEPHSPISYALEQAVRWGELPLPELLSELVSDESTREQLFKLVGIKEPKEEEQ